MITANKQVRKTSVDVAEVSAITCIADVSDSLGGKYFTLNGIDTNGDTINYYVWFDNGADPTPTGLTGIEVDITTNDNAAAVALAVKTAVHANANFSAANAAAICTITGAFVGAVVDSADVDTGFTLFNITTQGTSTLIDGKCELVRLIIGNAGDGDLYIKDGTTVLAKIDLTSTDLPRSIEFGIPLATSLQIITTAAIDLIIVYRT